MRTSIMPHKGIAFLLQTQIVFVYNGVHLAYLKLSSFDLKEFIV